MDNFSKTIDGKLVRFCYDADAGNWVVILTYDYREYTGVSHLKVLPEVEKKFVDLYFDNCDVKLEEVKCQQETMWMLSMPFMLQSKTDIVKLAKIPLGSNEELYIENRMLRDQVDKLTERVRQIELAILDGSAKTNEVIYENTGFVKLINGKLHAIGFDEDFKKAWMKMLKTIKCGEEDVGIYCPHDELDNCLEFMRTYALKPNPYGLFYMPLYRWFPDEDNIEGFISSSKKIGWPETCSLPFGVDNLNTSDVYPDINDIIVACVSYRRLCTDGKIYVSYVQAEENVWKMRSAFNLTATAKRPDASKKEWIIEW